MDGSHDIDTLMGYLGDFGKYQCWQVILHLLSAVTAGMHMLSLVTVAAVPDHRCFVPEVDFNSTISNYTAAQLEKFIPKLDNGDFHSCSIFEYNNSTNGTTTTGCDAWVYDTTYHVSSRGMEWDFVCHRRWMGAVATSAYMFGVFTGAVTLGSAADKYGRKIVFCTSALLQLILGVADAFVPEYYAFLIMRFLYGIFGSAGSYIPGFVLTMELVGASKRSICGIAFQAVFAFGIMLVAGWAAIIPDRQLLQVVYGLHGLLLVGHWWLMDESPRWLWSNGKVTESVKIIQKGLKMNGSPIQLDPSEYVSKAQIQERGKEDNAGIADLFKTPNLRKKTLNICLAWFANSLVYYGLSFSTGNLGGNPFLLLFLVGLVEIPGYIITVFLMDKTGRRSLISFYMITGGICCIVAATLVQGSVTSTSVVMLGKFLIASSFAIVYNYSAELFPTVIRNSAIGVGSMCARLSGTLMPLITLLDSFNPTLPSVIFALIAVLSGFLILFLPETLGYPMPQSIEDGENFGVGDTCFTTCLGRKHVPVVNELEDTKETKEQMQPLNTSK